jgi:hypothetical protein
VKPLESSLTIVRGGLAVESARLDLARARALQRDSGGHTGLVLEAQKRLAAAEATLRQSLAITKRESPK